MSASSKKKLRKEQKAEQMTQRQQKEQAEAKKSKRITVAFVVGIILVFVLAIGIFVTNLLDRTGLIGDWTTVATVGDYKISLTDFNYYYVDAVNDTKDNWRSSISTYTQYGFTEEEAAEMITGGLDLKKPITALVDPATGKNMGTHFVEVALSNAQTDYMLYDAAQKAGYKLTAEDQAALDNVKANLDMMVRFTNFSSVTQLLREGYQYGKYADEKSYMEYVERSIIAESYYQYYVENLSYTDADYRAHDAENPENYNSYSYAYYTVNVSDYLESTEEATEPEVTEPEVTDPEAATGEPAPEATASEEPAEGTDEIPVEPTVEYTAEQKEAARAKAEEVANSLIADIHSVEEFDEKIAQTFSPETVTEETTEENPEEVTEENPEEVTEENPEEVTEENPEEVAEENPEEVIDESADTPDEPVKESTKTYDMLHPESKVELREWLGKSDVATGSVTVIPVETTNESGETEITGYMAVYLVKKSDNTKASSDVRHLLVQVNDTENQEEWDAALAEAEKLLADWKAGEATEESFHQLVHDNTDDTASAETGGLYEDIHETSTYVDNFLAWCIDDARVAGDTEIVKTEYGYHIMYFVGRDTISYRDQLIEDELRSADADAWITALTAKYPATMKKEKKIDKDMVNLSLSY